MMGTVVTDVTAETTDVLQRLIRNSCVNEGTPESGHEIRSVDLLESYLRVPGVEMKRYGAQHALWMFDVCNHRALAADPLFRAAHLIFSVG